MKIKETVEVIREIHVAPCLKCGRTNIRLWDCGYSSFNIGGGECCDCGHIKTSTCDIFPSKGSLAVIWNSGNCRKLLIKSQKEIIQTAVARIAELRKPAEVGG